MDKQFYVYIMTNRTNSVLYTGVTSNLKGRVYQHRSGAVAGFTKRYQVKKLVYYEIFQDAPTAIAREKQIKAGSRADKIMCVDRSNREWTDLYETL